MKTIIQFSEHILSTGIIGSIITPYNDMTKNSYMYSPITPEFTVSQNYSIFRDCETDPDNIIKYFTSKKKAKEYLELVKNNEKIITCYLIKFNSSDSTYLYKFSIFHDLKVMSFWDSINLKWGIVAVLNDKFWKTKSKYFKDCGGKILHRDKNPEKLLALKELVY